MDKRFVLSAAGVAGATVAAPALAQNAVITMHLDFWAGEHSMLTSGSAGYVSTFVTSSGYLALYSGGSIVSATSFGQWNPLASSPSTSGYRWDINISGAGNYGVILLDAYGDGWAWASASGADAYVASGDVAGGSETIGFSFGTSASGSFTVTPAPGALALLGLAGLAGRRKRARVLRDPAHARLHVSAERPTGRSFGTDRWSFLPGTDSLARHSTFVAAGSEPRSKPSPISTSSDVGFDDVHQRADVLLAVPPTALRGCVHLLLDLLVAQSRRRTLGLVEAQAGVVEGHVEEVEDPAGLVLLVAHEILVMKLEHRDLEHVGPELLHPTPDHPGLRGSRDCSCSGAH